MPRPRKNGTAAAPPNRRKLTDRYVRTVRPDPSRSVVLTWDSAMPALHLAVYASGARSFRVGWRRGGVAESFTLPGSALSLSVAAARKLAARIVLDAAEGKDPRPARRSRSAADTSFGELHKLYVETYARRENRSWRSTEK